jgi:hypothetical protein
VVSAKTVAQSLAQRMEEEQREFEIRMLKQKEVARLRLEQANQELQLLRTAKATPRSAESPLFMSKAEEKSTFSKSPTGMTVAMDDSDPESDLPNATNSPLFRSRTEVSCKDEYFDEAHDPPSTVRMTMVESIIGDGDIINSDNPAMCIVEYDSD